MRSRLCLHASAALAPRHPRPLAPLLIALNPTITLACSAFMFTLMPQQQQRNDNDIPPPPFHYPTIMTMRHQR